MATLTGLQVGSTVQYAGGIGPVYTVIKVDDVGHAVTVDWLDWENKEHRASNNKGWFSDEHEYIITHSRKIKRKVV